MLSYVMLNVETTMSGFKSGIHGSCNSFDISIPKGTGSTGSCRSLSSAVAAAGCFRGNITLVEIKRVWENNYEDPGQEDSVFINLFDLVSLRTDTGLIYGCPTKTDNQTNDIKKPEWGASREHF
jgi:hypothetical protein